MKNKGTVWDSPFNIHLYGLLLLFVLCTSSSCGQNQTNPLKENGRPETKDTNPSPQTNSINFHTQYAYADAAGKSLIIQNSYPKGELYTDAEGNKYAKAT